MFCVLVVGNEISSDTLEHEQKQLMAKVRNLFDTQQYIVFTEHDFYWQYPAETVHETENSGATEGLQMKISFETISDDIKITILS